MVRPARSDTIGTMPERLRLPAGVARVAAAVAAAALLLAVACSPAAASSLPPEVRAVLQRAGVPESAFGAIALPLNGIARTWQHRADEPMQPGSTMKVLTSIVALERLGPGLRGRTELLGTGPVEGGVLRGDLVLRGGADVELGWPQLLGLLNELREQGVREIAGDLLLDRTLFSPARPDVGVPDFDDAPEWPYNVIPDALNLAGSLLGIELRADDSTLQVRSQPALQGLEFDTRGMVLTQARCADWDDTWQRPGLREEGTRVVVELRGTFPRGCTARAELQLMDRNRLAGLGFATLWSRLGGSWSGTAREAPTPAGARLLARRESRPWGEILRGLNKRSDNAQTRLLYQLLGVNAAGADARTPTLERAAGAVRGWLDEQGIGHDGVVLDNGSGLSRSERIRPRQLAHALRAALAGRHASELLMSLPVAGLDGTMRNRLRDSPAAGWARLKTGTLRNVRALAGVVPDAVGRTWVLVAFVNHEQAARASPALDALVDWVARGQPQPGREPVAP